MSPSQIDFRGHARRAAAVARSRFRPKVVFVRADEGSAAAFEDWCAAHSGIDCEIALSARTVHTCVAPAGTGRLTIDELREYALRQFQHYFGGQDQQSAGESWYVAVSGNPRVPLGCGSPKRVVDELMRAATAHRVRLRRVGPWWARCVAAALPADGAVAAVEPGAVTVLQTEGGRVCRVWTDMTTDDATCTAPSEIGWRSADTDRRVIRLWRNDLELPLVCDSQVVAEVVLGRAAVFPDTGASADAAFGHKPVAGTR